MEHIEDLAQVKVVHFYDVLVRATPCGLRGFEHRSTKHRRSVTCATCVSLLHDRDAAESLPAHGAEESSAASS